MTKSKNAQKLRREVADRVEQEGLDYTFRNYFPQTYADDVDPELAKAWHEYVRAADALERLLGLEDE